MKFYVSMDEDGTRDFWYGHPIKDGRGVWVSSAQGHLAGDGCDPDETILRRLWPAGIKRGECVEVKLPKLVIVRKGK